MKSWKNRPIITPADSPLTVYNALHESLDVWYENLPLDAADAWVKKERDAEGALQDAFTIIDGTVNRPEGDEALLYMSPDDLELALVGYGCNILDKNPDGIPAEIPAINGLLKEIDRIKSTV